MGALTDNSKAAGAKNGWVNVIIIGDIAKSFGYGVDRDARIDGGGV